MVHNLENFILENTLADKKINNQTLNFSQHFIPGLQRTLQYEKITNNDKE